MYLKVQLYLKYDRLTKVMVYGWNDKIMTDKLMHALSTMTEIALLWNPNHTRPHTSENVKLCKR